MFKSGSPWSALAIGCLWLTTTSCGEDAPASPLGNAGNAGNAGTDGNAGSAGSAGNAPDGPNAGAGGREVDCTNSAEPGPSPLRRLSRVEYGNTVFQLLGDPNHQRLGQDSLVPDGETLGFSNQAGVVSTSPLLASQYLNNAEALAEQHAGKLADGMPSCAAAPTTAACTKEVSQWLGTFGKRVYRRPLSADEIDFHLETYRWEVDARNDHRQGIKLVLQTLLQSPHFLYRPELGVVDASLEDGLVRLTSWEMATRLSYMFWNTMPDIGLFESAERDALQTPAQIETAARRLLRAERSRLAFRNFHEEWLDLERIVAVRNNGKDTTLFPSYDDGIPAELHDEVSAFFEHAIFEENASLETLFTASYTMMNRRTAAFYGIAGGPTGDAFEKVELDPKLYSGFLTQAGLLMANAKSDIGSPIHRGLFIRENILCQPPPSPPPDVPPPPMVDRTKTTREQFAEHSENATCAACHKFMDPLGLAFEHFDAVGLYREEEWGQPIDARGTMFQAVEGDIIAEAEFDGVVELGRTLAASERVKECAARQWFRYSMGRGEGDQDVCSLRSIDAEFARAGYDIKELLIAITRTPAFRYRRAVVPGGNL